MKKETTLVAALLCAAVSFGELSTLTPKVLKASWVDAWWRKKRVGAYARKLDRELLDLLRKYAQ